MLRKLLLGVVPLIIVIAVAISSLSSFHEKATAQNRARTNELPAERFWAENWIQFSFAPNQNMADLELDVTPFELFVNTQIALMKSPMVLKSVVENPAISRLPNIQKQVNPMEWIASRLTVEGSQSNKKSEIYVVTYESTDQKEAEMIVNAVVDSYISYYQIGLMQQDQNLQKSLQETKTRHEAIVAKIYEQLPAPQAPADANSSMLLAQLDREIRTIDHISDMLTRLEISRAAKGRVKVLLKSETPQMIQLAR